jgi:hypothetical protein
MMLWRTLPDAQTRADTLTTGMETSYARSEGMIASFAARDANEWLSEEEAPIDRNWNKLCTSTGLESRHHCTARVRSAWVKQQ